MKCDSKERTADFFEWTKTIKLKIPKLPPFINFIITAGLRFDEAIDSCNLIVQLSGEGKLNEYYNTERQILEHYRYSNIFIRRTKKAFMSFVSSDLIQAICECDLRITRNVIINRLKGQDLNVNLQICAKCMRATR